MKSALPGHHSCGKRTGLFNFGQSASDSNHAFDSVYMHFTQVQITFSVLKYGQICQPFRVKREARIVTSIAAKVITAFMVAS
jgi:hypothetical protein